MPGFSGDKRECIIGKFKIVEEFLTTQSVSVPIVSVIINLILAAVLSWLLHICYIKYGNSLSNRRAFARNLLMMTMTTTLIITIVKSSLALSLGLVGALSIVRFRTAIKEPEELVYLFLAIGIGLGLGADQVVVTLVAFPIILAAMILRNLSTKKHDNQNFFLTVTSHNPEKITLGEIIDVLKQHCSGVNLKRFDETAEQLEAAFQVEYDDFEQLDSCKGVLQRINKDVKITFLDNKAVI